MSADIVRAIGDIKCFNCRMKGPRWFNPTLYAGMGLGIVGILYTAYHGGYDVAETVGFAAISIFPIFLVLGLLLTALTALFNLISGRTHLPKLSPLEKRIARAYLITLLVLCSSVGFGLWHPLGWFWSIAIAIPVYVVGLFIARRLYKGLREEDFMRLQDRILATKEESNPLYFIP